jgi:predicted sulfurtransferase
MKLCSKCRVPKPYELFYQKRDAKDGVTPHCKACWDSYTKMNRERRQLMRLQDRQGEAHGKRRNSDAVEKGR